MAKASNIEWTDSTVNFWWGCTKVGPGCDHCYAETWSKRTGGNIWGTGVSRRKIKSAVTLLHRLDNSYSDWAADAECRRGNAKAFGLPVPHIYNSRRVFIQSMSDLFDLEVPLEWFKEAWQTIERCRWLHIQIVTKRISAVEKRLAAIGVTKWPQHAGLMITVCNQAEADRDIPRLLALKEKLGIPWVGLSIEPLLGQVDLTRLSTLAWPGAEIVNPLTGALYGILGDRVGHTTSIDWVIVGGESGSSGRPMRPDWARSLRDQCAAEDVPFFFKQWGQFLPTVEKGTEVNLLTISKGDRVAANPLSPGTHVRYRNVGKAHAGRLLDGIEHNSMPRAFS